MRKFRKRFKRPKSPYDMQQIKEGKELQKGYGLRRKKEIWIAQETLRGFRQRARELIAVSDPEKEKVLLEKLAKIGLLEKGAGLDNVLGLSVENLLERRLETIVFKSGLAKTPLQARQAIVHGHVRIGGRRITFPSYIVNAEEQGIIKCSFKPPEPPKKVGQVAKPVQEKPEAEEKPAAQEK